MPIFEYNGKKYNVPDDKVEGFKSRKPEATLVNSAPFYLADDKTVKNPQSANTVDPVQDDITNAAQRQDGFWATGVGDAIEKLGAGTLNTVGGIAKVLQETPTGKLVKKFSDYATEKTGVKPLIENNDVAGYLSKEGQKLSEKGDFHGNIVDEETGQVRKKTYRDLWKEGNKLGALGEVMLTATESAPTSALAMIPGGLALVSASAAGQKYSEINSNPETKDLPEWKKWLNASVSGVIEGATEKLGAKVDLKMIEPFLKKMTETTVKGILKKGGVNALIQTISEGAEEVLSQLGTNVVDYATGVSDEYKPFEGVQDSFVYGAGGGAQFGGVTGSAAVYRASTYAKDRHNANKVVKDADQQAGELFDGWDEVKSQLSGMSAEERTETLRDVLKRDNISIPAKKAFTDYVSGITYKESLTGAAEAKAVQDAEAGKETGQRLYDTLKDKRSIALSSLNIEKQELEAQLGDLASLPLTEIEESPEATPDIINAARKYNIVKSEFDGVMDRLRSEVDAYVQPQIESLEQVAKDGKITELNIGSTENPETVYLLSGDISFNEDGTVNREALLSPTINVKGSDGKKRQIGTHHVISGKIDDLEQTKEAIRQIAYDKYVNPLADKMEGKRHFELNETVEFVDDKGKTVAGKVNGKQGQAVQVLHSDGKTTSTFTETELDQRLIGETLGDVQIRDQFQVNIDGEMLDAEVQDISDGKATLYIPNNPVVAQRYMDVSLEELNQMRGTTGTAQPETIITSEKTPENEGVTVGSIQQNETETAETVSESQNSIEEQAQTVQEFPKDKDGNIDYAKITDNEAYVEALRSEFGDEAHSVVDEYRKAAEKALKGVSKINDPIRKRREQARRQAELDRWNVMFEATRPKQQAPTYEEEYNPILTKNSRERESQMGDYVSLRDFLLRNIGTGKLRFIWNSRDGRKGLKDEILSSKNTNAERLRRIAFLDNNGFTPESLAEFINDNHGQDIPEFSTLDVQDVRNEINDVLLSFDTPTDMIEAAERLRRDDMSLESYTEQNVSPEEIANYEANDVSQNELLLTLPEQETPEISEQELIEYYGNERGIEDIEQYPDTERGVYRGTEKRDQISLQAASDGVEAAEERQTGEQGARDSFAEPDQERAEQAIAGYDNQEDGASGTERKYSAGQRISIDGVDHEISEAGTYVGTNDHFYTLEKDGQTVYEDISQEELERLIEAKPIQGLDNYTEQDVKDLVRNQIDELIRENDLDVEVVDLAVIGSRKRGDAQDTSDLDVVVEYRGDISEDGLFNILNDEAFTIDDVQVDINPIKAEKTGTLAEYLEKAKTYDEKVTASKAEPKPESIEPEGAKADVNPTEAQKQQQFDIIQASNPMQDDVHTGIRSADEILTAEEAFSYHITNRVDATPDFTSADMTEALRTGKVTVFSSYPIENGVFVTPSKMEAQNFAGEGKVYSKNVPVTNVAWIDQTQGQYADVTAKETAEDIKPTRELGTGANVYFEATGIRVNDLGNEKIVLNVESKENLGGPAVWNIEFDTVEEAVDVASELAGIYPSGVPEAVLLDKVIGQIQSKGVEEPVNQTYEKQVDSPLSDQKENIGPKEIDVEGLFGALRTKGEAKLSDHVKYTAGLQEKDIEIFNNAKNRIDSLIVNSSSKDIEKAKVGVGFSAAMFASKISHPDKNKPLYDAIYYYYFDAITNYKAPKEETAAKPAYGANNKIITTERYNELREQMRKKLNNLNVGFDPEVFSIGAQMAMYHIESGAHKFADFAKRMVDDLGDAIRPYLKASYEGARAMPGMEELSKTMDPYKEVQAFDVNQRFEEPINNIEQNEQRTRSAEAIEAETETIESASDVIRSESENVGSNQQRAGDVKEQADEQVKKVETLLIEVEQKLANLKLSGKKYSTDGIYADYPINVLAKGPIKKDATAYVKAVAAMTGLEHDTDRKGKTEIVNVNIAPAGGDVTFVLWSKTNPDYGVYVSIPYSPDYRDSYDDYHVEGSILWRVTTKQDKWRGLSNQYVNSDVTAQEMAETLLKGLNQELRLRGLEQEINQVEKAPETVKNKRINKKTSAKVAKNQNNMLSLFGEEDVSPINTNQDERILQGNSQRLHQGSRAGSGSRLHTGGTRRNSGIQSNEIPQPDGTQQRSAEREGGLLPGDADVLNTEQEKSLEDSPALVPFEADRNDVEAFNKSKKYADNIEAIRTVLTLITENRKATPGEKKILSRYVGFGGLKEVLLDPDSGNWNKSDNQYKDQVREVIDLANRFDAATGSKDTFNKIRGSILNAHYTSATVIEAIYNGLKKIGFKKGNILEPSAGIGNFITYMPESIKGKSNISAVELDNLTGNILKYLHDNVAVQISGIENAVIPNNSQDLVISNVPFGNYKVYDKKFKGEKEQFLNRIHNYFFAKAIDQAREGGLIVFVTSKGVLDAPGNEAIRRYLNQNAEFLGAVRLPSNSFQKTANTQVTTDVIFLQKSKSGNSRERFIGVKEVDAIHKDGGTEKVSVNEYFINHPENMLGTIEAGGLYSRNDYSLIDNGTSKDLSKVIRSMLPENVFTPVKSAMGSQANDIKQSIEDVKEGNIVILNGSLFKKEEGVAVEIKINEPAAKIEKYIDLRNKLMGLIYSEYINIDSKELDNLRSQLNKSYDEFVKKYGKLEKSIKKIVKEDADGYNVQSLEIDGRKADIFTKRTISPISQKTHVESIDEAIIASLAETAGIDMERISQLMGKSMAEVVQESKGKLFEEPGGGFVTRDEYLSGNVKKKLREAKKAVEEGFTEFQYNIDELERVIPADIPAIQIEARAGSRWIPASVYTEFAQHILKSNGIVITYSKAADQYSHNGRVGTVDATAKYGTSRVNGADILVNALHINPPKVFDYVGTGSDRKAVLNQEETDKAMQKYQLIRDTFEDWVYKSQDRRTLLGGIYNERFNTNVKRRYDGSHLNIPGINGVVLRDHQKDAIWMLLQNGGGVIDHLVGAGKTFVMVAGTMEMKRTGVVKKPMIIALKSTIPQIVESYRSAYPMAKVLAPMEKDFEKKNRMRLFSKIANNEWDCIIMSHENYGKIPHEKAIQEELINDELDQLREEEVEYKAENNRSALKGVQIRIKNLEARLDKLADISKDNSLTFEQMGIDHIMVDESQQFKNLSYLTKQRGIAGLGKAEGSKRSFNLLVGLRYLQRKNKADKGATFLSGTPITNSIVEMYSLLNYLRPNKMAELGFTSFDSWATTFANPTMDIEFTVTNNIKQKTRFREFMNVPELSMLYTEIADIRTDENLKLDKPKMKGNGYTVEEIKMNEDQIEFGKRLTKFAETKDGELIGRAPLSEKEKSAAMLLATNLSSKMAIDMRLISNEYQYNPEGKIAKLVNNVARIFNETSEYKGTQLIFSDLGTPKNKTNKTALLKDYLEDEVGLNQDSLIELFGDYNAQGHRYPALSVVKNRMIDNLEMSEDEVEQIVLDSENSVGSFDVYNEVKFRLIEQGIPEEQIVFIHDYNTNKRKEDLFKKVNEGKIRIVLGSTQKLGTGVNVQERVSAVHHVDVPWTPASMEQRNGRAIRQGNWVAKKHLNNELPVYAYATERTLDAYKYQLLHTKQRFLNQVKSGDIEDRVLKEGDGDAESGVNYAELVAMLSGNKDILLKARLEEKVARLKRQKRNFEGELYESIEKKKEKEDLIPIIEKNISESKENVKEITDKAVFDEDGKLVITSFNGKEYKDDVKGEKGDKDKKIETARIKVAKEAIEYAEKWLKKAKYGDKTTINIGGYDILMQADRFLTGNNRNLFDTDLSLQLSLQTPNGSQYEFNLSEIPGVLLNNIQKIITDRIPDVLSRQQAVLEKTKDDIKAYDEIIKVGDKWSKQEEYDNALKELKEVNDRLDADIKKNESGTPQNEPEGEENDNEDILYRSVDESGFYSTVEDALEQIKQEKGTPDQFKAMLLKNGAKQAELDWMDYDGTFTDKSTTKADIQDWINQNRIEVQEVEKGNRIKEINEKFEKKKDDWVHNVAYDAYKNGAERNKSLFHAENIRNAVSSRDKDQINETAEDWEYLIKYNNPDEIDLNEIHDIEEDQKHQQYAFAEETKFSKYTLPGGKNYKELLLKMPKDKGLLWKQNKAGLWAYFVGDKQVSDGVPDNTYKEIARKTINSRDVLESQNADFKSSHFDEPNILAHVRFNDREVNGERVLFIEEIQSDWAQQGKKEGFKSDNRKAITESLRKEKDNFYTKLNESEDKQVEYGLSQFESGKINREQLDKILLANGYSEYDLKSAVEKNSVPDMPFKKTDQWVNLALRRMMMYAAENDYDRIAWTTGEQQAERYDLSKQVDKVLVSKYKDGYALKVLLPDRAFNNDQTLIGENLTEAQLEERIGKDLTQKVISDNLPLGQTNVYEGLDLKVGGEGMKAFYDQIVPKAAKKLGKPFGSDVETINLPISNEEITQNNADDEVEELTYKYESGELELDEFISEMNKIGYNVEVGMDGEVESANRKGAVYKSVQSIPVTDALREIAPNGMPLFRKRDTEAREAYAMREWNRAKRAIDDLAAKMVVSVEIIETTDGLPKAKAEAKGWYDTKSKKIAIVMPNHSNSWDAQATFLHEAVGHHGLRELFGEHFDTFLDNVYNNAEEEIKAQIDKKAQDKGWKVRKATEEYLSKLAEDQEILQSDRLSGFFNSVKKFFFDMLAKIGFNPGFKLSNNELKYILWRSYQNLAEPGRYRSVVDQAKDVAMQYGLKVGNYEEKTPMANVAEEPGNDDIRYREKGDKKKLNNAEYIRLTEAYNNAKTLDEKAEAAELIIRGIERVIGDDLSYIAKTHEEFIRVIPSLTEEEKSSIRSGEVQGMFDGTMTHLDVEAIENSDELINTWFHENGHRIVDQFNLFTKSELESLYDELNQSSVKDFLNHYKLKPKYEQAEEIINAGVEWIVVNNSLENIVNNDINYDFIPKQLRKFVETIFNTLQNEQLQKDQRREGGIREAGLSSSAGENNRGSGKNTGREDKEASTGDRGGIRFKRRSLENDIRSTEGNPGEKLNTLFDNADNLSKVVPNYPDFLNRVLQNSPKKQEIFRDARERGWNNLDKAIESYMASVEDADELGRIRELLGVEVPDNAFRYLLWRNANPNDGSPRWIAEEALKRKEFDGNAIFQKGKAPTKSAENEYEKRVRSRYNKGFRSLMFGIEEGWFDRMASLRILQNAITGGKAVPDKANAYMLENQLSSRNTSDIRYYNKNLVDPFVKQIHDIFGRNMNAADEYMNAKHGLERNVRMAEEEAKRKYAKNIASLNKEYVDEKIDEDTYNEKMEALNGEIEAYAEKLKEEKDYSGLTAIAAERGREDFKAVAQEIVAEIEGGVPKEDIDALWSRVNSATKWILDKQYNSGLMTKENYENIRNMYEYYVPLRGFAELTATDLYEYLQNPPSDFNGVLKTARGRTSKAESPMLSIMNMGESGIMQANRNRMKQAFYRLVATNPSNYASIEDVWLVKSGNDWQERFPEIDPNASGDEVADAIAEFNNEMAELAAKGEAVQGKNKLNVGVKILPAQASEHAIRVWIGGQEKVVYINGNPRAAQAINGLTQNNLIKREAARRSVEFWSRQMAANFTSRNPAFMITNFMRDVQFALISATVKEGGRYSAQLALNVTKVGKTIALNVWGKENTGNAEFQKYWDEFLANGGETGYANLHSIDQHRKYVNKKLREFSDQRDFLKPFREYTKFMENGNRMIEDMSRFATYVTSRQSGRSIERSVSDAKEITINFNRKGSGGFGANLIHSFYLFANPALQSMRLLGMMAKNHPVRFTAMLSSSMAMGTLVPFMNELLINLFGDDDDKDAYWNMAEWTRRNNLVLYMPGTKDKFVTLMLPHELRAFYGIGEMGYSYMNGRLRHQNMIAETAKQLTAMMPIDPFGGHDWWVPDAGKPLYQSFISNKNFLDRSIYKDTPWNKLDPEWTKAYKSTPSVLVGAAKWINEQSGGDEVVGGKVNLNPARAYHIFSGYMGGFLTTYTDLANVGFNLLTGRDVSLNDVPVGNKLIRTSDEKTAEMKLNSEYFYYLDWMREYEHAQSGYKKRAQEKDYRDKYIKLRRSNEGSIYRYAKKMRDAIDKLQGVNEEKAMELKKEFVEKMWEYESG